MKLHIIDSDLPLAEGMDRLALCGARVENAVFQCSWSDDELRELAAGETYRTETTLRGLCTACFRAHKTKRLIYGILPRRSDSKATA